VDSCGSPSTPASEQPTPFTSTSRLQVTTSAASTQPGDVTFRLLDAEEDSVVVFDGEDYTQADAGGDGASYDELQGSSSAVDLTPAGEDGPASTPEDAADGAAATDDVPPGEEGLQTLSVLHSYLNKCWCCASHSLLCIARARCH
jgi:hypothetical protein